MAETLAMASSIVGLSGFALHIARSLLDDLNRILNAPQVIENLKTDIASTMTSIQSLRDVPKSDMEALGSSVTTESEVAITSCERACDTLRKVLHRWIRRSSGGKLSWRDRAQIGFFKDSQLKAMSQQLQMCKLTFNSAVVMATLFSSIRNTHITEELRDMLATQSREIAGTAQLADRQMVDAEAALGLAREEAANRSEDEDGEDDDAENAAAQIEEQLSALRAIKAMLVELLSKIEDGEMLKQAASKGNRTMNIEFGSHNSGMQTGVSYGTITWNRGR